MFSYIRAAVTSWLVGCQVDGERRRCGRWLCWCGLGLAANVGGDWHQPLPDRRGNVGEK